MARLSLDLGIQSGIQIFKPQRYEGGGMRYLRFQRWLDEVHRLTALSELYFEEVRGHKGTDAAHVYGGLMATLTAWCENKHIPYMGIPVGTIKIHAVGKGNANKTAMMEAALSKGWTPQDHNEADALWLLDYVRDGSQ